MFTPSQCNRPSRRTRSERTRLEQILSHLRRACDHATTNGMETRRGDRPLQTHPLTIVRYVEAVR